MTKISLGVLLTCLFLLQGVTVSAQFPPDTQLTAITMPAGISKPAYLDSIIDPIYGTTITCISDETVFGPTQNGPTEWWSPYRRHRWFKMQPWNADGSKILIDLTIPYYLVDGTNYSFIKRYDPLKPQQHPPREGVWSNFDPDIIYGISENSFVKFEVAESKRTALHTFKDYDKISLGLFEGNISNNDKYVALYCSKENQYKTVVYNIQRDSVVSTFDMGPYGMNNYSTGVNWVSISQTGNYVAILWQRTGTGRYMGLELFDKKMNFIRQLYDVVSNGSIIELGLDTEGNDVVVYQNQSTNDIVTNRFRDGLVTKVLSGSKVSKSTTISCRNIKRPGWAYLSDFEAGAEAVSTGWANGVSEPSKASYNTVFALKLDGSETVEIFGHEHHSRNGGLYVQPMAVPNPTGRKVMFASVWDNDDSSASRVGGPFKTARICDYVAEYLAPSKKSKMNK